MKLKSISVIFKSVSIIAASTVMAASANASPFDVALQPVCFAQRHCPDVNFNLDTTTVSGIACTWNAQDKDAAMSLTTHFNDSSIDYVNVSCTLMPASNSNSELTEIRGAKAASISSLVINNNNTSTFTLKHIGTDNNANILFTLNELFTAMPDKSATTPNTYVITDANRYADGDKITCDFTVYRKK